MFYSIKDFTITIDEHLYSKRVIYKHSFDIISPMVKETTPEQKEKFNKGEQYLIQCFQSGGPINEIGKEFSKRDIVKERELKIIAKDMSKEEGKVVRVIKGFSYREEGELTDEDLELFDQLAQDLEEIPKLKLRYIKNDFTTEAGTFRDPTEVNYHISPDMEEFED
jgi:hypothetical protein